MLQLNELLFRSLPLFIQKYCATDTVEKVQMASPAGEIHRVPRRREPGLVPIISGFLRPTHLGTGFLGTDPASPPNPIYQGSSATNRSP